MSVMIDIIKMFKEDPIFSALESGKMCWGDILGDVKPVPRKTVTTTTITTTTEVVDDTWEQIPKKNTSKPNTHKPNTIKTIIARNLPRDITSDTLSTIFTKFGPVKDIYIPRNMDKNSPYYGTTKGFALIKFISPTDSLAAFNALYNNLTISKKMVTIEFAKEDR